MQMAENLDTSVVKVVAEYKRVAYESGTTC